MTVTVLIVVFFLAVNAFFVGTEFALVSVRRGKIRAMAQEGNRPARLLVPVLAGPRSVYRAMSACQVGITASSIALGAFVQVRVAGALGEFLAARGLSGPLAAESAAAAVTLVTVAVLQVVLGEMLPKSVALRGPLRWSLAAALPLRWSQALFRAFTAVLLASADVVLRLLRVPPQETAGARSPAEIALVVAESARTGALPRDLRDGIHNALRFATRTARDVMVPRVRVRGVPEGVSVPELRRVLREADHTRLPVYRGSLDQIIGFVHAKEVLLRTTAVAAPPALAELIRPVLAVPWSVRAGDLFERMRGSRTTLAVVLDEHGGTMGIVTLEDLVEEVVGEVEDEFDRLGPRPERLPDGRLRLRGEDPLAEVNDRFGLGLRSAEAHTVGGLVMERLGRIARPGDRTRIDGVQLEVERMGGRRIETVLATPPPRPGEGQR